LGRGPQGAAHVGLGAAVELAGGRRDQRGLHLRGGAREGGQPGIAGRPQLEPDGLSVGGAQAAAQAQGQISLHDAPATLAPLIARAALVVGRAGLIRYEAASLGIYGLYLAGGDAYAEYFRRFTARGFAEIYQEGQNGGRAAYLQRLRGLTDPAARVPLMQRNAAAMAAVDGRGAANVIDAVLTLIRPSA
jgi:hypothetical protein